MGYNISAADVFINFTRNIYSPQNHYLQWKVFLCFIFPESGIENGRQVPSSGFIGMRDSDLNVGIN